MPDLIIVDDHQMVLEGLNLLLNSQTNINVVNLFKSAQDCIEYLSNNSVDVILMDINMPHVNGIEACKIIKKSHPDIKIIGLSMINEGSLIKLMLKNGADGYLHKNSGRDEIIEAINSVMNGRTFISNEVTTLIFHPNHKDVKISESPFPKLSRREQQILEMIIDEKTTHEISTQLFISFGTVETHRRNIMIKLGAKNTAGLVRIALEYEILK